MPNLPTSRTVIVRPSAKINLTLHVGPKRDDGYHDLRTLLQSITLHDTLTISARRGPFGLACHMPGVPSDRSNLVWRAADVLWEAMGQTGAPRDAHIKLEKVIPSQAGLGGGSADAAAALVGLNTVWGARRSRRDLMRLGALIGSDVPFCLQGGTALGAARGEELYPVDDTHRMGVVVIKPSFGVSTAEAYGWLDEDRKASVTADAAAARPDASHPRDVEIGWPSGALALSNDLMAPVSRRHPEIGEMVAACLAQGAVAAQMSGSGSAVFALFAETGAARAARQLKRPDWLVLVSRTQTRREAARSMGL
ncbi:MAG: 4-(cytidine 5'-diphospho)-2-C-methyl-D-erythritol kinase [Acidobacteria bacterium]|nr:4-(cytidine 5'-diphospho)-2-C-methyl-D-erythritol kinase [Acidobacteriota bacterium]